MPKRPHPVGAADSRRASAVGRARRRVPAAARGFTLLEVVVAVALMAVLATLSWRGLDSVLRTRERLTVASDDMRALTAVFAQLEEDLRSSWSARAFGFADRLPLNFSRATVDSPPGLDLLRESGGRDEALRMQAVSYRLREGRLERGFAPWQTNFGVGEPRPPVRPTVWQPLLSEVTTFEMRAWVEEQKSWVLAGSLVGMQAVPQAGNIRTISGLEVVIARAGGGPIARVLSFRD